MSIVREIALRELHAKHRLGTPYAAEQVIPIRIRTPTPIPIPTPIRIPISDSDSDSDSEGRRVREQSKTSFTLRIEAETWGASVWLACPDAKEPRQRHRRERRSRALSRFCRWVGHASQTDAPHATLPGSRARDPRDRGSSSHRRAGSRVRSRSRRAASARAQLGRAQHRGGQSQPGRPPSRAVLDGSRLQQRVSRCVARSGRVGLRARERGRSRRAAPRSGRRDAPPPRSPAVTRSAGARRSSIASPRLFTGGRATANRWSRGPARTGPRVASTASSPCRSVRGAVRGGDGGARRRRGGRRRSRGARARRHRGCRCAVHRRPRSRGARATETERAQNDGHEEARRPWSSATLAPADHASLLS